MKTATIGYIRGDGDLAVLATLNNNDEHLREETFDRMVEDVKSWYDSFNPQLNVKIFANREDAIDYVDISESKHN